MSSSGLLSETRGKKTLSGLSPCRRSATTAGPWRVWAMSSAVMSPGCSRRTGLSRPERTWSFSRESWRNPGRTRITVPSMPRHAAGNTTSGVQPPRAIAMAATARAKGPSTIRGNSDSVNSIGYSANSTLPASGSGHNPRGPPKKFRGGYQKSAPDDATDLPGSSRVSGRGFSTSTGQSQRQIHYIVMRRDECTASATESCSFWLP